VRAKLVSMLPYAALLAGAAYLFHRATGLAAFGRPGQLGPDFWPKAVLGLLMITCVLEIARQALARPAAPAAAAPVRQEEEEEPRYPVLLALGIGITLIYVPGMQLLGFFAATTLYLAAFMLVGRYRRWGVVAAASVLGSLAFVFVFMKIVYVSLPLGLGPFRSLSIALMALLGIR
jgi:hypothetical protein